MYTDVPKCLRCCFCLPLRYSLAAWGYFKVIVSLFFLVILFWSLVRNLQYIPQFRGPIIALSIMIALISTDTVFDVVLIVAAYKKHVKLFQCYYYYSVVILTLLVISVTVITVYQIVLMFNMYSYATFLLSLTIENTFLGIGIILAQVYVTLLVRTEMIKLRDNCKFEFVNKAAESQCTVEIHPQI